MKKLYQKHKNQIVQMQCDRKNVESSKRGGNVTLYTEKQKEGISRFLVKNNVSKKTVSGTS